MAIVFLIILVIGLLTLFVGSLMLLMAAFRQSVLWGVAYLCLPFANLIFLIKHWAEAKSGFFVTLAGLALIAVPVAGSNEVREGVAKDLQARFPQMAAAQPPAPDLTAQIATQRSHIEQLEGQFAQSNAQLTQKYQALAAARKALKPNDTEAVTRFNAEAAAYTQQTTVLRQLQQAIADAHKKLDDLLTERAKKAAGPSGKQVVMYTTNHCPACQQAKQYFAQRGVHYEERDVEQSRPAAEEFQKLGGHGVPLIMVGDKRMEGFSAPALDHLL